MIRTAAVVLGWTLVSGSAASRAAERLPLDSVAPRRDPVEGPERSERAQVPPGPRVGFGRVEVSPGIPNEVIRRILRQNAGRYRLCYEKALERQPKLAGMVEMRFAIQTDGSMSRVVGDGSTVPDAKVIDCILGATARLSFPKPALEWGAVEGEPVKVRAQLLLQPGEGRPRPRRPAKP